jgi:hypothetical protein
MHDKHMVWTDLKAENYVNFVDEHGINTVKCVDLDSATPAGGKLTSYTPKSIPPELAIAIQNGTEGEFVASKAYDLWGLGLLIWFVYFGKELFDQFYVLGADGTRCIDEPNLIRHLADPLFGQKLRTQLDTLNGIPKLQSVLEQLLSVDPLVRPSCEQVGCTSH